MVIACLVQLLINGHYEDRLMTGQLKQIYGEKYIVDFSNATDSIPGIEGKYTYKEVDAEFCSIKVMQKKVPHG